MTDQPSQNFNDEIEHILRSDSSSLMNIASNDPALHMAAHLTQVNHPQLSPTARADILQQVLDTMPTPTADAPKVKPTPQVIRPAIWTALLKAAAGFIAVLLVAGLVTVPASANSVPGDALYPIKRQAESLQLALSFTPASRADVHLEQSQKRADEINVLLDRDVVDNLPVIDGVDSLFAAIDIALENDLYDEDRDLLLETEEMLVTYFDLVETLDEKTSLSGHQIINHWRDEVNFAAQAIYDVGTGDNLNRFGCEERGNSCNTPAETNSNANGNSNVNANNNSTGNGNSNGNANGNAVGNGNGNKNGRGR